ncbi:uncharacterized protein [Triticum aestivum]|uniref:uncharacterized protein n=1 Tax=Triticum aestivum TaxID=4565 RepID=UPI001D0096F8|nr:uncharacterized protein LOC123071459 [Triticum aestivum]XP_044350953.1 uncharacterized protein LOC123071459 [Triticum aestivum]XP_044350954.1 uncharacterized protein LOC123071459 [Triticum aestivum]XP_044350955.1 uncharacterized protein LOC123071459 [Triticum aestivum]XP_044350956.1 uncharacterized protein LOC123071459 [Triticum aestivum]XP_044350957.1 uncharacterized protein LOC123071459 [Triticum aestivum]XP_044350958.1 uncharacterized protein LOC123071459 [Triticum aestivum]XP_04435095
MPPPRVRRSVVPGFPSCPAGRAARIPPLAACMAGGGARPPGPKPVAPRSSMPPCPLVQQQFPRVRGPRPSCPAQRRPLQDAVEASLGRDRRRKDRLRWLPRVGEGLLLGRSQRRRVRLRWVMWDMAALRTGHVRRRLGLPSCLVRRPAISLGLRRRCITSRGHCRSVLDRRRHIHRRLSLVLGVRVCPVAQPTVVLTDCPGDNVVTMVTMRMVKANIVVHHRRVAAVVMLGRAMVQLRDLFTALRVALLRGHQALTTHSKVTTVVIVAEVAGTGSVSLLRLSSLSRRTPRRRLIPVRRQSCQVRLWRWCPAGYG